MFVLAVCVSKIKPELLRHRVKKLFCYDFVTKEDVMANPLRMIYLNDFLGMYDWSMASKFSLDKGVSEHALQREMDLTHANVTVPWGTSCVFQMFGSTVRNSGSDRHSKYVESTDDMRVNFPSQSVKMF